MNRTTILIVSDEGEFSNAITSCWLTESNVPAFVRAGSREDEGENFDLAIVGEVHRSPAEIRQGPKLVMGVALCTPASECSSRLSARCISHVRP